MSKRDDILKATIDLIVNDGLNHTTISNILETASTGYGTLYHYFESKEVLFLAVYMHIVKQMDDYVFRGLNTEDDIETQFETGLRRYLDYCLRHQDEYVAMEALWTLPDICKKAKEAIEGVNISLLALMNVIEEQGIVQTRIQGYNTQLLLGMISTFVKFFRENGYEATEIQKKDFVSSCMRALQ